jgi:hypothetical protein
LFHGWMVGFYNWCNKFIIDLFHFWWYLHFVGKNTVHHCSSFGEISRNWQKTEWALWSRFCRFLPPEKMTEGYAACLKHCV